MEQLASGASAGHHDERRLSRGADEIISGDVLVIYSGWRLEATP